MIIVPVWTRDKLRAKPEGGVSLETQGMGGCVARDTVGMVHGDNRSLHWSSRRMVLYSIERHVERWHEICFGIGGERGEGENLRKFKINLDTPPDHADTIDSSERRTPKGENMLTDCQSICGRNCRGDCAEDQIDKCDRHNRQGTHAKINGAPIVICDKCHEENVAALCVIFKGEKS